MMESIFRNDAFLFIQWWELVTKIVKLIYNSNAKEGCRLFENSSPTSV